MQKRKNIAILIILLLFIIAITFYYSPGEASIVAQKSNMIVLRTQIMVYKEKHGIIPINIAALELDTSPNSLADNIDIENIQYPVKDDDSLLFYEKESKRYGFRKGRFFVCRDGEIKFITD